MPSDVAWSLGEPLRLEFSFFSSLGEVGRNSRDGCTQLNTAGFLTFKMGNPNLPLGRRRASRFSFSVLTESP